MIRKEVTALFQSQREFGNPFAKEAFETAYTEILFSQRHFDEGPGGDSPYQKGDLRGNCTFEPDERRAFKACYTFEYFKLLQDLNHIRILSPKESTRELTQEERQKLIALALKSSGLDYSKYARHWPCPRKQVLMWFAMGMLLKKRQKKRVNSNRCRATISCANPWMEFKRMQFCSLVKISWMKSLQF